MKNIITTALILFVTIYQADAQDLYRTTRSLEVQQAVSHIGQAEYYVRMALRSLESSEKAGRAPFFDYKRAREDLKKIQDEYKTYLGAEGSPARASAVPLVIDGRYFADSIRNYLSRESASKPSSPRPDPPREIEQGPAEKSTNEPSEKQAAADPSEAGEQKQTEAILAPPAQAETQRGKREKIEDILKKGL